MVKRILIDAVHPEEIRVAVTQDSRLQEFDYETAAKKQIKGNIYLAKITRVEPSLQAAFVEYGGNKQGFLPFSEIHPDYYHIPVSDQEGQPVAQTATEETAAPASENSEEADVSSPREANVEANGENNEIETISDEGDDGEIRRPNLYKRYKIQEVIKRGQVMLVQVIKEERGNKGASLTAYLSLPGRYCVFMPNTERQGGVSRRIGSNDDRRRLKTIIDDLTVAEGSSVIIRTAGSSAQKDDIERDYGYLQGTWEEVKKMTVSSSAPKLIYEEGNIIKRAIRDLYDNNINEIIVEGEDASQEAKNVMKILAPDNLDKLKTHNENVPIFWHYNVENELAQLYDNKASLKSGGYIVINSTEALVAIDVNSGKSTKERNVEETATKTNLEAAQEIARQLRLRDLAGLIVIDFIDMMEARNRKSIEKSLRDALGADRAKIQIGRISPFGLLEMSRQRLRSSLVENNTTSCPTCKGSGIIKSQQSAGLKVLSSIITELSKGNVGKVNVTAPSAVALYLLNRKREDILLIEDRYDASIVIEANNSMEGDDFFIKAEADSENDADKVARRRKRSQILGATEDYSEYQESAQKDSNVHEITEVRNESRERFDNRGGRNNNRRRRGGRFDRNRPRRDFNGNANVGSEERNDNNRGERDGNRHRHGGRNDGQRFRDRNRHENRGDRPNHHNRHGGGGQNQGANSEQNQSLLKNLWKKITQ